MSTFLKNLIKRNFFVFQFIHYLRTKYRLFKSLHGGGNTIVFKGYGKIIKDVIGTHNTVIINNNTYLNKTTIRIRGNNNKIVFGEGCSVGPKCSFWLEGNNLEIIIGDKTSFTHTVHFCAQEENVSIIVGEDCMFSNTITVRTSDSHPIYSEYGERINNPQSVYIGMHVWIAPGSKIMKGAKIFDGSIIGSNSFVTKEIPENSLAVGSPAKVVKNNISWTRERIF